jgi:ketosteroid isomerase-like protein
MEPLQEENVPVAFDIIQGKGGAEVNKAVARRYFDEFLNQGKGVVGEDLFAPNYRSYFPGSPGPLDKQEHDHVTITFFSAFPDGHFTVEDVIAEGDKVVSRYTFRGTHQGRWTAALVTPQPANR